MRRLLRLLLAQGRAYTLPVMHVMRVISGGQTGADRAGLDAALHCDTPHGGWCPKGRRAEDGVIPARYHLRETTSEHYLARTEQNVMDSDATLVFTFGNPSGGSFSTIAFARTHNKPYLHVDLDTMSNKDAAAKVINWLAGHPRSQEVAIPDPCVLNIAGSRASEASGIHKRVYAIMVDILQGVAR